MAICIRWLALRHVPTAPADDGKAELHQIVIGSDSDWFRKVVSSCTGVRGRFVSGTSGHAGKRQIGLGRTWPTTFS